MKQLAIVKKSDALKLKEIHPNAKIEKYDSGKYHWEGSQDEYVGRVEPNIPERILALWVERRTDRDGAYAQVMCLYEELEQKKSIEPQFSGIRIRM
ncbi:DUF987 family protein [Vibrio cholerae]|uniref:DUF987 family protein n=1 Tax=Vibrio cholerae TaxID=666 RepID=UPI0006828256|nr:DUF987 family protein [Vibrio cholerae]